MNILDPKFQYNNAAETSKPGYLQRRFAQIRKEMVAKPLPAAPVIPIKKDARNGR